MSFLFISKWTLFLVLSNGGWQDSSLRDHHGPNRLTKSTAQDSAEAEREMITAQRAMPVIAARVQEARAQYRQLEIQKKEIHVGSSTLFPALGFVANVFVFHRRGSGTPSKKRSGWSAKSDGSGTSSRKTPRPTTALVTSLRNRRAWKPSGTTSRSSTKLSGRASCRWNRRNRKPRRGPRLPRAQRGSTRNVWMRSRQTTTS